MGIYDSEFGDEDSPTNVLLDEYTVPKCFSPDIFDMVDETDCREDEGSDSVGTDEGNTRPPYRWVLIGPERSGTGMHVDPLWTNAWVSLIPSMDCFLCQIIPFSYSKTDDVYLINTMHCIGYCFTGA